MATCQALAVAFDCPLELVLRQAGILPPVAPDDYAARLAALMASQPVAEQREIYEYAIPAISPASKLTGERSQ